MSLTAGRTLGPYEIISLLGVGGMGEVYKARDTRLNRTVAIKVLPAALSATPALRERFEREARAISALSHPNICALYDIGSDGGTEYLVMEYLEGESLAERLSRGALPASQLLRYGVQIAEALHKAHRAGITHRDLKPGNIMLTSAGAKLLDFGLAKFVDSETHVFSEHSAPATAVGPLTAEGTIVGTLQYMSPEQLEGKVVDPRSDIFALGVILYEMATAAHPFRGDSPASLIASILSTDPPPLRTVQPAASPALEKIIHTALEKNPDERWQTAHDLGRQLRWISETSATAEYPAGVPRRRLPMMAAIVATAVLAAIATWATLRFTRKPAASPTAINLDFVPLPGMRIPYNPEALSFSISPDGQTIAIEAFNEGSKSAIYARRLDSDQIRKVEGTDDGHNPIWSSDGNWLAFNSRGSLWKVRAGGGAPPEMICRMVVSGGHVSWQGDTLLLDERRGGKGVIYRVPSAGGEPAPVTTIRPGEWRHSWPVLLPDGHHFLYLSLSANSMDRKIVLADLDSTKTSTLVKNVSQARVYLDDRLAFVRDGDLLTQRFDLDKGTMIGDPQRVASQVNYFYPPARADFDVSRNGAFVYRSNTSTGRLAMIDRTGKDIRVIDADGLFWDHRLSPDGKRAAVTVETRTTGLMDIWIYDLNRGLRERFTSEPAIEVSPAWTPDSRSIVYSQAEGGTFPHLVIRALDSATSKDLLPRDSFQFSPSFSSNGSTLYYERDVATGNDIYKLDMKTGETTPFLATSFYEGAPAVSPAGDLLAFVSRASGSFEVYVQKLDSDSPRARISTSGGQAPRWSRDGTLFYVTPARFIASATAGASSNWNEAKVTNLFQYPREIRGFDVAPDGQSFLISDWARGDADESLHVMVPAR
jgi:eukaryotic-like serine/threonine-protein kinase